MSFHYHSSSRSIQQCFLRIQSLVVLLLVSMVATRPSAAFVLQQHSNAAYFDTSRRRRASLGFHQFKGHGHMYSQSYHRPRIRTIFPDAMVQSSTTTTTTKQNHHNTQTKRTEFSAHTSPLFSAATSTPTTSPNSQQEQQQPNNKLQRFWNVIQHQKRWWLLPTLAILVLPRWVGRKSLDSLNFFFETVPWKQLARVVTVVWVLVSIVSTMHTNQRQAQDATSEWSRYAEKPGARGRAIMWLLVQQAILILAARITSVLFRAKQTATAIRQVAGHSFSNGLLKLGPLYIKLGQIVSCRKGLLGKEWIDAMADLQDRVPARTGQDALELAYATLEGGKDEFDKLFVDFDATPLAAASLGQVHRAKLRSNNHEVAVKVQRPYLRKIYDQDFVLLTTIAQFMDRMPGASKNVGGVESSWKQIFVDAEDILYREIDYRDEAENAMRFANDFGLALGGNATKPTALSRNNKTLASAADWLRTPYVYADLSNERLLVMEYVPSIKITNLAKLDAANVTEEDRIELADNLARAYLRQFCCNMFFSTDPHPGNLGVEMVPANHRGGEGKNGIVQNIDKVTNGGLEPRQKPRLVMYDFGQAATLNRNQADGILEIIEAIVDTDVDRSVAAFQKMGVLVDNANLDEVRDKVADNYRTGKVKANRKKLRRKGFKFRDEQESSSSTAVASVDGEVQAVPATTSETPVKGSSGSDSKVMSSFSLPAEYAFVARAISQMDGVGKSLDPEFDFISSAAPYLVEVKGADLYIKEEFLKFVRKEQARWTEFQEVTLPKWWSEIAETKR